ncbi:hypothetical protein ACHQM5_016750 [Ranunculus cassubicifolius]
MAKLSCFSVLIGRRKKHKDEESPVLIDYSKSTGGLDVKKNRSINNLETNVSYSDNVKVVNHNKRLETEAREVAYERSNENDENPSPCRDLSDFDLQAQMIDKEATSLPLSRKSGSFDSVDAKTTNGSENKVLRRIQSGHELIQSAHVSDPGLEKVEILASPILKRSCSALETRDVLRKLADRLPPKKSRSFGDLQKPIKKVAIEVSDGIHGSPESVMSPRSADKVMLKKHSSSQVLPSRSRKLWWKLFLWSHRNMHKPSMDKRRLPSTNHIDQRGGYCSDTLEQGRDSESSMSESPGSFSGEGKMNINQDWDHFQGELSGSLPQNQWVAFSTESSSLNRVNEWVNSVQDQTHNNDDDTADDGIFFPPSPEAGGSPARSPSRNANLNMSEDVLHANNVIQSLNTSSTVAHITGMGLKVIPAISRFSSLRSINLSGNFIVHITAGSLPKGLHTLNLSRNKIAVMEGLRDLTRLRVLDLSYNRISRIGQGLSNTTLIKELYLAGNKISIIEGLHRLLKLTVLDMSFNKLSTAKALGQLVANYNSLQALNILGNPIQSNIGDDQLRKVALGLLPRLVYLNKQSIKPQRAREVAMDSVARAALGNSGRNSRRKVSKQSGFSGSYASSHKSSLGARKNKHLLPSRK